MVTRDLLRRLGFVLATAGSVLAGGGASAQDDPGAISSFAERFHFPANVTKPNVALADSAPAPRDLKALLVPFATAGAPPFKPEPQNQLATFPDLSSLLVARATAGAPPLERNEHKQADREQSVPIRAEDTRGLASRKRPSGLKRIGAGRASFYEHPGRTASGERYNPDGLTAAHRSLPLGTRAKVVNLRNGKSVVLRINDRTPPNLRVVIDLSRGSARAIGIDRAAGVGTVALYAVE